MIGCEASTPVKTLQNFAHANSCPRSEKCAPSTPVRALCVPRVNGEARMKENVVDLSKMGIAFGHTEEFAFYSY